MSKGSKIVQVRFGEVRISEMESAIAKRNIHTRGVPWTLSDFIRVACREKLAHMKRARTTRAALTGEPEIDILPVDLVPNDSELL